MPPCFFLGIISNCFFLFPSTCYSYLVAFVFFFFFISSGGWGKKKLSLTTPPTYTSCVLFFFFCFFGANGLVFQTAYSVWCSRLHIFFAHVVTESGIAWPNHLAVFCNVYLCLVVCDHSSSKGRFSRGHQHGHWSCWMYMGGNIDQCHDRGGVPF